MVKILDNFLDIESFQKLQLAMMENPDFPWHYNDFVDYLEKRNELDTFQFEHWFYRLPTGSISTFMDIVEPILDLLDDVAMWRIKANLLTRTQDIVENEFHIDIGNLKDSPKKLKQWTTAIFYVNTNNGYTKFETGEVVESVKNRMVTFPSDIRHTGTSCSDEKVRVVINFNYFSSK
tara:strand:- start:10 stop:540 length:531 start_codon:yes stop_codon:yes gene_type:complete